MSNQRGNKPDSQVDPLLTLYSEKMKYLAECHKVYYWMLALFATGLVVSAGFLFKSGLETIKEAIPYLAFGGPILINAWCAGYLFCYWHNHYLCQNIERLEKLIGKEINNSDEPFPTWYEDFFGAFIKTKYFTYVLFITLALPILFLDIICIRITLCNFNGLNFEVLRVVESQKEIIYNVYIVGTIVLPIIFLVIHIYFCFKEKIENIIEVIYKRIKANICPKK